jgi:L-lactate dehydrogenase complex protein LldG
MDRESFLKAVREGAAAGRAHPVPTNPSARARAAYVGAGDDPVDTFLREWTAVGGQGYRVRGTSGLLATLHEILHRHTGRSALLWNHPVLDRHGLEVWLAQRGVACLRSDRLADQPAGPRWEAFFAADLGITSVDAAIAETGSLVLASDVNQARAASLLPPVHVAVLEPWQIVPDLFDLFPGEEESTVQPGVKFPIAPSAGAPAAQEPRPLPSNLVLVTGPSKTGDIQLQLTTGVHGPGTVYALVVESVPSA